MKTRNIGLWPWLFQRISGVYLIIGMLVHLWTTHISETEVRFFRVSDRLAHGGWFLFDLSLVAVVVYHGLNGAWNIILDYNPPAKTRNILGWSIVLFGLLIVVYGAWALVPFGK